MYEVFSHVPVFDLAWTFQYLSSTLNIAVQVFYVIWKSEEYMFALSFIQNCFVFVLCMQIKLFIIKATIANNSWWQIFLRQIMIDGLHVVRVFILLYILSLTTYLWYLDIKRNNNTWYYINRWTPSSHKRRPDSLTPVEWISHLFCENPLWSP